MRTAALTVTLISVSALAQPANEYLYVNPALVVSSSRINALAGASTGIGEGAEGMASNYAAAANRDPRLARKWDWDATFSLVSTPVPLWRDFENDGRNQPSTAPAEAQLGVSFQFSRLGIGLFARSSVRTLCTDAECSVRLSTSEVVGGLVFAVALVQDQLIVGLGAHLTQATLSLQRNEAFAYDGKSFGGGVLLRPHHLPFRLGAQLLMAHTGELSRSDGTSTLFGRPVPRGTVSPARLSVGASVRLGEGRHRYNRVSKALIDELPTSTTVFPPHDELHDVPPGRVLLVAQVDVYLPVKEPTTTATPFLLGEPPPRAGSEVNAAPRLGVEWEAIDHRLRLRAGTWLEPAFITERGVRVHGSGGAELFVFHLLEDWSVSLSFDFTARYFAAGLGIGFWK